MGMGEPGEVLFQVLEAASGQVLATPGCGPAVEVALHRQPGSCLEGGLVDAPQPAEQRGLHGRGRGPAERDVHRRDRRGASLRACRTGRLNALFVDSKPGEEPETSDLPEDARPPIGVMEGGLAVHWDAKTGVITANPIKE